MSGDLRGPLPELPGHRSDQDVPDRLEHERGAQVKYFDVEPAEEGEFRRKDGQTTCPECDRKIGFGKGWQCSRCETWFCDEKCGDPEDGKSACWSCSDGFWFPPHTRGF